MDVLPDAIGFNGPPELVDAAAAGLVVHGPQDKGPLGVGHVDHGTERQAGQFICAGRGRHGVGGKDRKTAEVAEIVTVGRGIVAAHRRIRIAQFGRHVGPGGVGGRVQFLEADDIGIHAAQHGPGCVIGIAADLPGAVEDVVGGDAHFARRRRLDDRSKPHPPGRDAQCPLYKTAGMEERVLHAANLVGRLECAFSRKTQVRDAGRCRVGASPFH